MNIVWFHEIFADFVCLTCKQRVVLQLPLVDLWRGRGCGRRARSVELAGLARHDRLDRRARVHSILTVGSGCVVGVKLCFRLAINVDAVVYVSRGRFITARCGRSKDWQVFGGRGTCCCQTAHSLCGAGIQLCCATCGGFRFRLIGREKTGASCVHGKCRACRLGRRNEWQKSTKTSLFAVDNGVVCCCRFLRSN